MNLKFLDTKFKLRVFAYGISFLIFLIALLIFNYGFTYSSNTVKIILVGIFCVLLSPKLTSVKTQAGNILQMKWIFLKKTLHVY